MNSMKKIITIMMLIALASATVFAGAGNRTGTGGASELLIPTSARDLSLGGSTISITSGLEALAFNPAGVVKTENQTNVLFSHMSYIADIGVEYGAVSTAIEGIGTLALHLQSLSIGDIPVTTTANPDGTGETFRPQFFTAGASYARQVSERISVGITMNLITERIANVSATGVSFDMGIIYDKLGDLNGLSLGVAIKNIGPQMKYDGTGLYHATSIPDFNRLTNTTKIDAAPFELPSTLEFGVGYKSTINESNIVQLSGTFQNNNFSGDEYKAGVEYGYDKTFFVRGGYTMSPTSQSPDYIYGFTAGAGINYQMEGTNIGVNYAYRATKYFDGNHLISLAIGF